MKAVRITELNLYKWKWKGQPEIRERDKFAQPHPDQITEMLDGNITQKCTIQFHLHCFSWNWEQQDIPNVRGVFSDLVECEHK